ncbi:hypothetical protein ACH4VR_40065 [Streptomyces sp. NPDC020883]|uniref:hypothetical protein n=1 Tax=Streptomyces sp. NPDC020883 TaxID=3365099 RepID=UPI00378B0EF3
MDEVHGAGGRFAQQAAAVEEVAEDGRGGALGGRGGDGREGVGQDAFGAVAVEFGSG